MKLKATINNVEYPITAGPTKSEEWNETLDSGSIIIPHSGPIEMYPFDDVWIESTDPQEPYESHMLVDSIQEIQLVAGKEIYNYVISLCSEAKGLEKIILPNVSIRQPLDKTQRRDIWFYLEKFVKLYSPKIRVVDDEELQTWKFAQKYEMDDSIREKFQNIDAPEITMTSPTLREFITQLMLTADCIPVVHDWKIGCIDISKPEGTFRMDDEAKAHINFIHSSMSSESYSTQASRTYSQAISESGSGKCIELIGFRNSESGILTLGNLRIETRFPIYKINSIKMCYYASAATTDGTTNNFLVKQDITKLVVEDTVRNSLSTDYTALNALTSVDPLEEFAKYRWMTVGYSRGSKSISGWGEIHNELKNAFLNDSDPVTNIQNIFALMSKKTPFGEVGPEAAKMISEQVITSVTPINLYSTNKADLFKSLLFEIDYEAMYEGTLKHRKKGTRRIYETVDNSSSALTILERDGISEKSKMERLSNKIYSIQARYDSVAQMESYGHKVGYETPDGKVIYSREIQIYPNFVLANFQATPNYALKNYYTSVWAKHRNYNLMQMGEATTRSENRTYTVYLSAEEFVYEPIGAFDGDVIGKLAESVKPTEIPENKRDWSFPDLINIAWFTTYDNLYGNVETAHGLSDVNGFSSGTSIAINARMHDNATNGAYIESNTAIDRWALNEWLSNGGPFNIEKATLPSGFGASTRFKGSSQQWDVMAEDVENPFVNKVGIRFGHLNPWAVKDYAGATTQEISDLYAQTLYKFPTTGNLNIAEFSPERADGKDIAFAIGEDYELAKDNNEVIDFTFQISYESADDKVHISPWFAKLNPLVSQAKKLDDDAEYPPNFEMFFYSRQEPNLGALMPMACIKVSNWFTYPLNAKFYINGSSGSVKSDEYSRLNGTEKAVYTYDYGEFTSENQITLHGRVDVYDSLGQQGGNLLRTSPITAKFNLTATGSAGRYYYALTLVTQYTIQSAWTQADLLNEFDNGFRGVASNYQNLDATNSYATGIMNLHRDNTGWIITDRIFKNMFIVLGSRKVQPQDEFEAYTMVQMPDDKTALTTLHVADVIDAGVTNGKAWISVDPQSQELDDAMEDAGVAYHESIQLWYKGDDNLMHFVFGFDCKQGTAKRYIYLSILENPDRKVYKGDRRVHVGDLRDYSTLNAQPEMKYD